jgi:hypothetical protein
VSHWKIQQDREGRSIIQLQGTVSGSEAPELAEEVRRMPYWPPVQLDLSQCRGAIELLASRPVELLQGTRSVEHLRLTGLSRHHRVLLGYMGLQRAVAQGGAM